MLLAYKLILFNPIYYDVKVIESAIFLYIRRHKHVPNEANGRQGQSARLR